MKKSILKKKILIFKNDAVGDLTHSLIAIGNIAKCHKDSDITIFLSERSKNFSFLIKDVNIKTIIVNYNLTIFQKIKFLSLLTFTKVSKIFILTPKNFYFVLPFIFRNIKFYALCINGPNSYKRPNNFLRKYLFKFIINDREAMYKRISSIDCQINLTKNNENDIENSCLEYNFKKSDFLQKYLPKNYIYFHFKKDHFNKLGWDLNDLDLLFNEFLKHYKNIIFTRDIENNIEQNKAFNNFNILDFSNNSFIKKNNNIFLYENITGKNLYNIIKHSDRVVAFHGMMTNLAAIEKKKSY